MTIQPWYYLGPNNQNVTQAYNPPIEYGTDIGETFHTLITNLIAGWVTDIRTGGYGVVVHIRSLVGNGKLIIQEYLHLDEALAKVGQFLPVGGMVGLSGGQNVGGLHPVERRFSTGPHIEYGTYSTTGQSVNSLPYLQAAEQSGGAGLGQQGWLYNLLALGPQPPSNIIGGTQSTGGGGLAQPQNPGVTSGGSLADCLAWVKADNPSISDQAATQFCQNLIGSGIGGFPAVGTGVTTPFSLQDVLNSIGNFIGLLTNVATWIRILKGVVGTFLILIAVVVVFLPEVGQTAAIATTSAIAPELTPGVAAAFGRSRKKPAPFRESAAIVGGSKIGARARPKPAPEPSPVKSELRTGYGKRAGGSNINVRSSSREMKELRSVGAEQSAKAAYKEQQSRARAARNKALVAESKPAELPPQPAVTRLRNRRKMQDVGPQPGQIEKLRGE